MSSRLDRHIAVATVSEDEKAIVRAGFGRKSSSKKRPKSRRWELRARRRTPFLMLSVVLISSLISTGCFGRKELEDRSIVTVLGVDKGEHERVFVTAVMAIPRKARPSGGADGPSGSGGGQGGESVMIVSEEGKDITEAFDKLDLTIARRVTTVQTQVLLLGEEFARDDVSPIADVFTRNLDFRHNTLIAVCQGKARDFLLGVRSPEETELSAYLVRLMTSSYRDEGACPFVTVHEFIIAYSTVESEPWAPYLALASPEPAETGQKETASGDGDRKRGSQEGKPPTSARLMGAAVFKNEGGIQKMVGTLDPLETKAANMLKNTFLAGSLQVAMPSESDKVATITMHHFSQSTSFRMGQEKPEALFRIRVTASWDETLAKYVEITPETHEALVQTLQDELRILLSKTMEKLKSLGSDVIDLGMTAHKSFKTWDEWQEYNWPEKFKQVQASFDVKAHIFNSGFTLDPPKPR